MNKSEIIRNLSYRLSDMPTADVDRAVNLLLDFLGSTIAAGNRCEVRGFGVFSRRTREARASRNPKTGAVLALPARYTTHFKPGKELRERVDNAKGDYQIQD